jgi:WG repeat protein
MMRCLLVLAVALAAASGCVRSSRDQLLVVVQGGKYGFIDHRGRIAIPPQFEWADDFWRGQAPVYVCGRYASIDSSGAVGPLRTAPPGRLAAKRQGQKVGFVDEHGGFGISPSFDDALPFSEGLAAVKIGQYWGFVDTSGSQVIKPRFSAAFYFREGVATAELESSPVLIDRSGRVLASGFAFIAGIVSHGRVPATRDGRSGYLDLQGHVAIPLVFDSVDTFSDGLAAVERAGKWGYIDPAGRLLIPFAFDEAGPFGSGVAPIRVGTRTGFINRSGGVAFDLPFESASGFLTGDNESNWFVADADVSRFWTADGKFGCVNTSGRVIWGPSERGPDHAPLLGWSDAEKAESCTGIPESTKALVRRLPPE